MRAVVGVDAGGTNTRALALSLDGDVLGYSVAPGGNPNHNSKYRENLHAAIHEATRICGLTGIARIVAGVAGYDHPKDLAWLEPAFEIEGCPAQKSYFNDADVAHYGAFGGEPGVVSIQGTGSIIVAHCPDGRRITNFDFGHYAHCSAWALSRHTLGSILAEESGAGDEELIRSVLDYWQVQSIGDLRELGSRGWDLTSEERTRKWTQMTSLITDAAQTGSPLAQKCCRFGGGSIIQAIHILGPMMGIHPIRVAMIGSVGNAQFIADYVRQNLGPTYEIISPKFSPVVGAALMALKEEGVELSAEKLTVLKGYA